VAFTPLQPPDHPVPANVADAMAVQMDLGTAWFTRQSSRGLKRSKTLRVAPASLRVRSGLDYGGPPPLFPAAAASCANVKSNCHGEWSQSFLRAFAAA
jgi:hypothetical protein